MTKLPPLLLSTVVFLVAFGTGSVSIARRDTYKALEQRHVASKVGIAQAYSLERQLERSLSSTYALAAVLRQVGGRIDNFDLLAADTIKHYGGISSLQLAPKGVIKQIYPLAGNEKLIGVNLLKDPRCRIEAGTMKLRTFLVMEPDTLIQGGGAIIGRLPVFLPNNDKNKNQEQFWGFAIALLPVNELFKASNLNRLAEEGYDYELSHIELDSSTRVVFARSTSKQLENPVAVNVEVPNGKWKLSIAPKEGWRCRSLLSTEIIPILLISILVALLFYTLLRQPEVLRRKVLLRTQKLADTNQKLKSEIIERQQTEAALRESEERLQAILDNTTAVIYLKDIKGRYILVNRQYEILFHLTKEQTSCDIFPDRTDTLTEKERQVIETGTTLKLEEAIAHDDGVHTYISIKFPLKDYAGVPYAVCSISTDITERKRAQEALQNIVVGTASVTGEEFFKDLVRHVATSLGVRCAFVTQVADSQLQRLRTLGLWMNDSLEENVEYDLVGTPCKIVIEQRKMTYYLDGVREFFPENPLLASLDAIGYLGVPLFDTSQKVIGNLCIVDDKPLSPDQPAKSILSVFAARAAAELERKWAEEEIYRLNAELEERVIERTAQLEAANKELEAFSYSVSHDLRAPLRHINGFSKMLIEDCADRLDDTGKYYLQRMQAASDRMGQLIEDLLNLSRVARGSLHQETMDLSIMARAIAIELQQCEPSRQVEFQIPDSITANGDARLLQIVLENLIGNSWKYTAKHQSACIEVGIWLHPANYPVYFVRDDGAGFDMTYADKLFGAFQRLHAASQFPGTGIGLATVQRIVHRHGGKVWAESAIDRGATFYFTLQQ